MGQTSAPPLPHRRIRTTWNSTSVTDGSHTITAVAKDAAGNSASASVTVTVRNTPPVISSISSGTPVGTQATITWTTDEAANSQVQYGTAVSYGTASSSAVLATSHSITLTDLTPGTIYHFQVQSVDGQANTATSSDQTFLTPSCSQSAAFLARTNNFTYQQEKWYDSTICTLVTEGTFAKLDGLYILAAPTQQASLLNLVQNNYNLTVNGTMTFGPNAGWMGDGSTGSLATGFTPSTAGGHYQSGNASLGVGISDPRQANESWTSIGALNSSFAGEYIAVGNSGNFGDMGNHSCGSSAPPTANGAWIWTYNNPNINCYQNGTSIGTASGAPITMDEPIVIGGLYCPGCSLSNVVDQTGDTLTWAFFGSGLTPTDVTNLTNASASIPTTTAPVPAAFWGYSGNLFNYNFATQGLTGIDVNTTLAPGYPLYTTWWFGCYSGNECGSASAPSSAFSYTGSQVIVGNASTSARLATAGDTSSAFTGTISGNTLTVASILYGPILARQVVSGNAALSGQTILSQLTGTTGGVGTYQLSGSATIATTANLLGNSSVGTTFAPGGYYEISMSYDPSLDNGSNGFPSFWLMDINGLYAQNLNSGYGEAANFTEWDVFEAKSGSRAPDMNGFDWTDIDGGTGASNLGTNNAVRQNYPTVTNPTSQHLYGMLWVPSTRNAGTGLIQFYLDRVHIAGSDITYTSSGGASPACSPSNPNGCLFDSESGQFVLLIDSGGGGENPYPANLTSMDVWH